METKVCGVCKEEKPVEEFYWKKKGKLRQYKCILCQKAYSRQWYEEHRDLAIARAQEQRHGRRPWQAAQSPAYSTLKRRD